MGWTISSERHDERPTYAASGEPLLPYSTRKPAIKSPEQAVTDPRRPSALTSIRD
jgi:hypothetical protein